MSQQDPAAATAVASTHVQIAEKTQSRLIYCRILFLVFDLDFDINPIFRYSLKVNMDLDKWDPPCPDMRCLTNTPGVSLPLDVYIVVFFETMRYLVLSSL